MLVLFLAAAFACGEEDAECASNDDCPGTQFCNDGECRNCWQDSQCPAGYVCKSSECLKLYFFSISGKVLNWKDDSPLEGAKLEMKGHEETSDANGRWSIAFEGLPGSYSLDVSKTGYRARELEISLPIDKEYDVFLLYSDDYCSMDITYKEDEKTTAEYVDDCDIEWDDHYEKLEFDCNFDSLGKLGGGSGANVVFENFLPSPGQKTVTGVSVGNKKFSAEHQENKASGEISVHKSEIAQNGNRYVICGALDVTLETAPDYYDEIVLATMAGEFCAFSNNLPESLE